MNFKKIALGTAAVLSLAVATTFALPRHVTIERSATMNAAPDAIIEFAASNAGYQSFNPYRDLDPNLSVELFGPSSGVGSVFSFESKDGAGQQTVAAVEPGWWPLTLILARSVNPRRLSLPWPWTAQQK